MVARTAFHAVVQQPVLRRLLPAFAVSAIGDGMAMVAVAWLAITISSPSDRAVVVGLAVAAYTLPGAAGAVLLARPLRALAGSHLVAADATLRAVTLGVISALFVLGALGPVLYIALLAASSLLHAWGISGQFTLVAEHLPAESRTAGNALLTGFGMASFVVGPALAGLTVALAGPALPVAIDAASFAVLAVAAVLSRGAATGADEPDDDHTRTRGFAAIARNPVLLGLLTLTVFYYFLYGPVEVALPLYVSGPLHGDAGLLGLFWTVFGIGATLGSVVAGVTRRLPIWPALLAAVVGWGLALLPMGLVSMTVPAMTGFALGGLLYAPYPALSMTLFQRESAPRSLSQVLAARGAITVLATPLGTALGGPLSSWLGAQRTLLVSALATIASGMAAAVFVAARARHRGARPDTSSVSSGA